MRRHVILLLATIVVIVGTFLATVFSDNRPVLGLDLQGGVSIVLFPEQGADLSTLGTAAEIIRNRVDAIGVTEPEVSVQGDTIVVDLPGVEERDKAEDLIGQTAELRFRPVVGNGPIPVVPDALLPGATTTTTVAGAPTTTTVAGATTTTSGPAPATSSPTTAATGDGAQSLGTSIATAPIAARRPAQAATTTSSTPAPSTTAAGATTTTAPGASTTTVPIATTSCAEAATSRADDLPEASVVLPDKDPEHGCYVLGPTVLTGRAISDAKARYAGGEGWVVDVEFSGNEFVDNVAQPYVNQQVAIVLDGVVQSAPVINPGITGRNVQISGSFSEGEARDLALVLRYGSLPVQFDPTEQTTRSVSPSLGKDQLRAGIVAGLIGLGLVALYMILFYRLLGVVVWIGLGLTALVFWTLVSNGSIISDIFGGSGGLTLTLAGVTGIIVSVGVTVDSYVVYFERLKDEVRTGKTVRSSLDTGFHRAFRTIIAADLVSLLGAGVLFALAEGSVRGFAFFLGLSTLIDLVLSYVFMHPLVAILARRPVLVRMRGVGIATGLDVPEARA